MGTSKSVFNTELTSCDQVRVITASRVLTQNSYHDCCGAFNLNLLRVFIRNGVSAIPQLLAKLLCAARSHTVTTLI